MSSFQFIPINWFTTTTNFTSNFRKKRFIFVKFSDFSLIQFSYLARCSYLKIKILTNVWAMAIWLLPDVWLTFDSSYKPIKTWPQRSDFSSKIDLKRFDLNSKLEYLKKLTKSLYFLVFLSVTKIHPLSSYLRSKTFRFNISSSL